MLSHQAPEERYPLLLLYVEENGKRSEFPQRVSFPNKSRGKQLVNGAAAIITQWPAQVTSCWFSALALGGTFLLTLFILIMSTMNPLIHSIRPRCTHDPINYHGNKTVHLIKDGNTWSQRQLDLLKFIADTYSDFDIHTLVVEMDDGGNNNQIEKYLKPNNKTNVIINNNNNEISSIFLDKLNELLSLDKDLDPNKTKVQEFNSTFVTRMKRSTISINPQQIKSYDDMLKVYKNIHGEKIALKDYFQNTPLQFFWMDLTPEMVLFAMRIQELWQYGGISFKLPNVREDTFRIVNGTNSILDGMRLKLLVASTRFRYENIPENLVSVDGQGIHMATRTPCHTFFGEMLMKLQRNVDGVSVPGFIQKTLSTFCGRGAVDSDYCNKLKKKT